MKPMYSPLERQKSSRWFSPQQGQVRYAAAAHEVLVRATRQSLPSATSTTSPSSPKSTAVTGCTRWACAGPEAR